MNLQYVYHSEHHATSTDRWRYFLGYLCALLLLFAAGQKIFHLMTQWGTDDHAYEWLDISLAAIYALGGIFLALAAYRMHRSQGTGDEGEAERFVHVNAEHIHWHLNQQEGEVSVALTRIAAVERPNIRDLNLTLTDGSVVTLPIYLITSADKQNELIEVLAGSDRLRALPRRS